MSDAFRKLDPLVAVGGNSRAARSARARLQLRDRYGRFMDMGAKLKFKVHFPSGTKSVEGKLVGVKDADTGQVYVTKDPNGLKDGFYDVHSENAQEILASLTPDYLASKNIVPGKDVDGNNVEERLSEHVPDADKIPYSDAPEGWVVGRRFKSGRPMSFNTDDGDYTFVEPGSPYKNDTPVLIKQGIPGTFPVNDWPDALDTINQVDAGAEWGKTTHLDPNPEDKPNPANPNGEPKPDDNVPVQPAEQPAEAEKKSKIPADTADTGAGAGTGGFDTDTFQVAKTGYLVPTTKTTDDISPQGLANFVKDNKTRLGKPGTRIMIDTDANHAEIYKSVDDLNGAKAQAGGIGVDHVIDLANDKEISTNAQDDSANAEQSQPDAGGANPPVGNPDSQPNQPADSGQQQPADSTDDKYVPDHVAGQAHGAAKPASRDELNAERDRLNKQASATTNDKMAERIFAKIDDIDAKLAELDKNPTPEPAPEKAAPSDEIVTKLSDKVDSLAKAVDTSKKLDDIAEKLDSIEKAVANSSGGDSNPPEEPPTSNSSDDGMSKSRAESIIESASKNGGHTVDTKTWDVPDTGYIVAQRGFNQEFPEDEFFSDKGLDALTQYVIDHKDELSKPGSHLGVWHDKKKHEVVLDTVEKIDDKDAAITAGRDRNQQSIWDVANGEEIDTGGTGDRAADSGADQRDSNAGEPEPDDGSGDSGASGGRVPEAEKPKREVAAKTATQPKTAKTVAPKRQFVPLNTRTPKNGDVGYVIRKGKITPIRYSDQDDYWYDARMGVTEDGDPKGYSLFSNDELKAAIKDAPGVAAYKGPVPTNLAGQELTGTEAHIAARNERNEVRQAAADRKATAPAEPKAEPKAEPAPEVKSESKPEAEIPEPATETSSALEDFYKSAGVLPREHQQAVKDAIKNNTLPAGVRVQQTNARKLTGEPTGKMMTRTSRGLTNTYIEAIGGGKVFWTDNFHLVPPDENAPSAPTTAPSAEDEDVRTPSYLRPEPGEEQPAPERPTLQPVPEPEDLFKPEPLPASTPRQKLTARDLDQMPEGTTITRVRKRLGSRERFGDMTFVKQDDGTWQSVNDNGVNVGNPLSSDSLAKLYTRGDEKKDPEDYGYLTPLTRTPAAATPATPTPTDLSKVPVEDFSSEFEDLNSKWRPRQKPDGSLELFIPGTPMGDKEQVKPLEHIYRVISEDEWNGIQQNGFIQSDGRMNIAEGEGTVAAHRDPSFYAPHSIGERSRIVQIDYNPEDGWWLDHDGYLKNPNQIPASRISAQSDWTTGTGGSSLDVDDERVPAALIDGIRRQASDTLVTASDASGVWGQPEGNELRRIADEIDASGKLAKYGSITAPDMDRIPTDQDVRDHIARSRDLVNSLPDSDAKTSALKALDDAEGVLDARQKDNAPAPEEAAQPTVTSPEKPEAPAEPEPEEAARAQEPDNAISPNIDANERQAAEIAAQKIPDGAPIYVPTPRGPQTEVNPKGPYVPDDKHVPLRNPIISRTPNGWDPMPREEIQKISSDTGFTPEASSNLAPNEVGEPTNHAAVYDVVEDDAEPHDYSETPPVSTGSEDAVDGPDDVDTTAARIHISQQLATANAPADDTFDYGYEDSPEDYADQKFMPTQEQRNIIKAVLGLKNVAVQALAGTGKTSTLELIAHRLGKVFPNKRVLYIAFNRSVKLEAERRMPKNVTPTTFDALGYNAMPKSLTKKMNNRDALFRPRDIAQAFGVQDQKRQDGEKIGSDDVARDITRAINNYSNSDRNELSEADFDGLETEATPEVMEKAHEMWDDLKSTQGKLKLTNSHITKMWALTKPDLSAKGDIIFYDEAQDINPVSAKVVRDQKLQKVYVGDSRQAIYGFRGAVNELDNVSDQVDINLPLTQSWRFGPEVAAMGNRFLTLLKSKYKVIGGGPKGEVVPANTMNDADVVIVRSNAGGFTAMINELAKGRTVGIDARSRADFKSLLDTARWLQNGGRKPQVHPDFAGYKDWDEVERDVKRGKADTRTTMLFNLVEKFGTYGLEDVLNRVQTVRSADDRPEEKKVAPGIGANKFESINFASGSTGSFWSFKDSQKPITHTINYTVTQEPNGDFSVALSGSTFPQKDLIKTAGFRWDKDSKGWKATGSRLAMQTKLDKIQSMAEAEEKPLGAPEDESAPEIPVDVVVTTAHKAKGLEWGNVAIGTDFRGPEVNPENGEIVYPSDDELRLAYVAVTRAQKVLDPGSLAWVLDHTTEQDGDPSVPSAGEKDIAPESISEPAAPAEPEPTVQAETPEEAADTAKDTADHEADQAAQAEEAQTSQSTAAADWAADPHNPTDAEIQNAPSGAVIRETHNESGDETWWTKTGPRNWVLTRKDGTLTGIRSNGSTFSNQGSNSHDAVDAPGESAFPPPPQAAPVAEPTPEPGAPAAPAAEVPAPVAEEPEESGDGLPDTAEELEALAAGMERNLAGATGARARVLQREIDKVYEKLDRLEQGGEPEPLNFEDVADRASREQIPVPEHLPRDNPDYEEREQEIREAIYENGHPDRNPAPASSEPTPEAEAVQKVAEQPVTANKSAIADHKAVVNKRVLAGKDVTPAEKAAYQDQLDDPGASQADIEAVAAKIAAEPNRPDTGTTPIPAEDRLSSRTPTHQHLIDHEANPANNVNAHAILQDVLRDNPGYTVLPNGDIILKSQIVGGKRFDLILRRTDREEFFAFFRETDLDSGKSRLRRIRSAGKANHSYKATKNKIDSGHKLMENPTRAFHGNRTDIEYYNEGDKIPDAPLGAYIDGTDIPASESASFNEVASDIAKLAEDPAVAKSLLRQMATKAGYSSVLVTQIINAILRRKADEAFRIESGGNPDITRTHVSHDGRSFNFDENGEPPETTYVDWTDTDETRQVYIDGVAQYEKDANGDFLTRYGKNIPITEPNPNYGKVYRGIVRKQRRIAGKHYKYSDEVWANFPEQDAERGLPSTTRERMSSQLKIVDGKDAPMSEPFFPKNRTEDLAKDFHTPDDFGVPAEGKTTTPREPKAAPSAETTSGQFADGVWKIPGYDAEIPVGPLAWAEALRTSNPRTLAVDELNPGDILPAIGPVPAAKILAVDVGIDGKTTVTTAVPAEEFGEFRVHTSSLRNNTRLSVLRPDTQKTPVDIEDSKNKLHSLLIAKNPAGQTFARLEKRLENANTPEEVQAVAEDINALKARKHRAGDTENFMKAKAALDALSADAHVNGDVAAANIDHVDAASQTILRDLAGRDASGALEGDIPAPEDYDQLLEDIVDATYGSRDKFKMVGQANKNLMKDAVPGDILTLFGKLGSRGQEAGGWGRHYYEYLSAEPMNGKSRYNFRVLTPDRVGIDPFTSYAGSAGEDTFQGQIIAFNADQLQEKYLEDDDTELYAPVDSYADSYIPAEYNQRRASTKDKPSRITFSLPDHYDKEPPKTLAPAIKEGERRSKALKEGKTKLIADHLGGGTNYRTEIREMEDGTRFFLKENIDPMYATSEAFVMAVGNALGIEDNHTHLHSPDTTLSDVVPGRDIGNDVYRIDQGKERSGYDIHSPGALLMTVMDYIMKVKDRNNAGNIRVSGGHLVPVDNAFSSVTSDTGITNNPFISELLAMIKAGNSPITISQLENWIQQVAGLRDYAGQLGVVGSWEGALRGLYNLINAINGYDDAIYS